MVVRNQTIEVYFTYYFFDSRYMLISFNFPQGSKKYPVNRQNASSSHSAFYTILFKEYPCSNSTNHLRKKLSAYYQFISYLSFLSIFIIEKVGSSV